MSYEYFLKNGEKAGKMVSARSAVVADFSFSTVGPSMTREEFADECDINNIMARYDKAGVWPMQPNGVEPIFYDFTEMPTDLMSSMQTMIDADEAFMRLPAVTRKEFDNDAMRFVEFASKPDNLAKMREWGLAEPEKVPDAPMRVEVVNAPPIVPAPA